MTLVGFKAQNHPQQVESGGTLDGVDDRATEVGFFRTLDQRFGFSIDVAASAENTKCKRFYDRLNDGLSQPWSGERVWCNPPYSSIAPWVQKAWLEARTAELIVMLLPANRTEQTWWQELVEAYRDRPGSPLSIEFLPGRLRFLKPGQVNIGANERPPFGCCLLIWEHVLPGQRSLFDALPSVDPESTALAHSAQEDVGHGERKDD